MLQPKRQLGHATVAVAIFVRCSSCVVHAMSCEYMSESHRHLRARVTSAGRSSRLMCFHEPRHVPMVTSAQRWCGTAHASRSSKQKLRPNTSQPDGHPMALSNFDHNVASGNQLDGPLLINWHDPTCASKTRAIPVARSTITTRS